MMPEILQYSFMIRALIAGCCIALIAPLIGIFLVARRYSLIADTLGHVSLAGIAIGLLIGVNPIIAALIAVIFVAIIINNLHTKNIISGESTLAMLLSGGLALAVVLSGFIRQGSADLFSYLFGSITTVRPLDLWIIIPLTIFVVIMVTIYYKPLFHITFNEDMARVAGLPVERLNLLLMLLTAVTVGLSVRIVGSLLIGALIVIPVSAAIQVSHSFKQTLLFSIVFSLFSVICGLVISFYFNLAAGGTIVLFSLSLFGLTSLLRK